MLAKAGLLILLAAAAFAGSFYLTEKVHAHGTHCDSYGPLYCDYYYAAQYRCCASAIQGLIKAEDVSMVSPTYDRAVHWVGLTEAADVPDESVQMGFVEGHDPDGDIWYTPKLYTEFQRTSCSLSSGYISHGTPGGLWDQMYVSFTGDYYTCPSNSSIILYRFDMRRGGPSGTLLGTGYMGSPYGRYDATTEHLNLHAIEPNGTQCFGTNSSCSASTTYGLKVCCTGGSTWILWPSSTVYLELNSPYNRVPTAYYYSFYTYGAP